jgi:hypothetical protein
VKMICFHHFVPASVAFVLQKKESRHVSIIPHFPQIPYAGIYAALALFRWVRRGWRRRKRER